MNKKSDETQMDPQTESAPLPSPYEGLGKGSGEPPDPLPTGVIRLSDMLAEDDEPVEWLVPDLIPAQSLGILTGPSSAGKTRIATGLGIALAGGASEFAGWSIPAPRSVLVVQAEMSRQLARKYSREIATGLDVPPDELQECWYLDGGSHNLDNEEDYQRLVNAVRDLRPSLLVIDSFSFVCGIDENSNAEVARIMRDRIRPLVDRYGTSVLMIAHVRKSGGSNLNDVRGASSLTYGIDYAVSVERSSQTSTTRTIDVMKSRYHAGEPEPVRVTFESTEGGGMRIVRVDSSDIPPSRNREAELLDELLPVLYDQAQEAPLARSSIRETLGIRAGSEDDKRLTKVLQSLFEQGIVEVDSGRNNAKSYRLVVPDDSPSDAESNVIPYPGEWSF